MRFPLSHLTLFFFHLIFFLLCSKNNSSDKSKTERIHRANEKLKQANKHLILKVDEKIGLSFQDRREKNRMCSLKTLI